MNALRARLGDAGVRGLLWLWLGVRDSRPTGELSGWTVEDVEMEADWRGEPGRFVEVLLELRWLNGTPGAADFRVHDWSEHQRYAIHAKQRSDTARFASHKRHHKHRRDPDCSYCSEDSAEHDAARHAPSNARRNAPSPSPSPSPSPIPNSTPLRGVEGGRDPKTGEEAWTLVQRALKDKQPGQKLRDMLPPLVWATVEVIGVDEVREPKNRAATRAHFLKFYAASRKAER
jgi:hypothetical protein